jgi:hypothetical protein
MKNIHNAVLLDYKDEVYDVIATEYIMKYRDPNSLIQEDVESNDVITRMQKLANIIK